MAGERLSYDRDYWRRVFVAGSMDLKELAQEQGSPAYSTLRKWAMATDTEPSWAEQRTQFRYSQEQKLASVPEVQYAVKSISRIVDSAEMMARHIKACKLIGSIALQAFQSYDPKTLKPSEATAMMRLALDYERLTEGLATQRQEIDLSGLSDAELEKLARG